MRLGEYIKKYRKINNLSLRRFAEITGVSNSYLSMLETGRQPSSGLPIVPSLTKLDQIAKGMHMELSDLLAAVDDMPVSFGEDPGDTVPNLNLSPLEKQIIICFRQLPEGEKNMILRSLGICEKGDALSEDQAAG